MSPNGTRSPLPDPESLGKVLDFMRVVWALDHALQARSKRMSTRLGLTGPQRMVLRLVGRYPRISAGALADTLHVHPSTLTGILQRLEARKLVERVADPLDLRRALLLLTREGELLDRETAGTVEAAVSATLERLPRNAIRTTREVLLALTQSLVPQEEGPDPTGRRKRSADRPAQASRR